MASGIEDFDFAAYWQKHRRALVAAAATVVVVGGGGWFWTASRSLKESRAENAFGSAERTFYSGNNQLASAELNRVVLRYQDTRAGVRATMLLAQTLYAEGRHADGVELLRGVAGSRAAKAYRAPVHALVAGGLENQAEFAEAAVAFAQAAAAAPTAFDRDMYHADQARALTSAGNRDGALAIWQGLAERESSPVASEAKLRIGELSVRPASS